MRKLGPLLLLLTAACPGLSPTGATLSFLSKIEFFIKTDTLPEVRIAEALAIPSGARATGTQPSQNTNIEADLKLPIEANIL